MKKNLILLLSCVCITIFARSTQAQKKNNSSQVEYQSANVSQEKLLKFYVPIKASPDGITNFLRHIYNDPEYTQDYLPNDFSHLYQLLVKKQSRSFAQAVLRLFGNKEKACTYINAHAFSCLLEQLPTLVEPYFSAQRPIEEFDAAQKKINTILYARFLDKFPEFKKNPTLFFDDLSHEIVDALLISQQNTKDISIEELRKTFLIFLEVGLSKLIWSPNDGVDTWKSVKTISDHLTKLTDVNAIVDSDDLNGLFVTLLERYCYFLDIASSDLPLNFYEAIQQDIAAAPIQLLTHAEQENMIETKLNRFKRALTVCQAKTRASKHGMIV